MGDTPYRDKDRFWFWTPPLQGRLGPKDFDYEQEETRLEVKRQIQEDGMHWTTMVKLMGGSVEAHKRYLDMVKDRR
ncbi:hypothetical protein SLS58_006314 [Diplodia intermedia]|uniref:Myb-like domain-containing protein n=1 Tax=Diplodia intermedia TaxID=856260 RepID=A0ABR3TN52_9PEZI